MIAVRNTYRDSNDYQRMVRFFDTLHASNRLRPPRIPSRWIECVRVQGSGLRRIVADRAGQEPTAQR